MAEIPKWALFQGGITLYPFQIETVNQAIRTESIDHRAVITEPFGSGKTFIALSLIRAVPLPSVISARIRDSPIAKPYVVVRQSYANQIIRPTAIVVARTVYAQWLHVIRTYTTFRVLSITDVRLARILVNKINTTGEESDYDIILIKNNKTYVCHDLCHYINLHTGSRIWSRVIYDDVDANTNTMLMRAGNYVYITGAKSLPALKARYWLSTSLSDAIAILPFVINSCSSYSSMWIENSHSAHEISESQNVPPMLCYDYEIRNHAIRRVVSMLGDVAIPGADELSRMITGDALETASGLYNVVATPDALFAQILGNQCDEVKSAIDYLNNIDEHDDLTTVENTRDFLNRARLSFERIASNVRHGVCIICLSPICDTDEKIAILRCCGVLICVPCIDAIRGIDRRCPNCRRPLTDGDIIIIIGSDIMIFTAEIFEHQWRPSAAPPPHTPDESAASSVSAAAAAPDESTASSVSAAAAAPDESAASSVSAAAAAPDESAASTAAAAAAVDDSAADVTKITIAMDIIRNRIQGIQQPTHANLNIIERDPPHIAGLLMGHEGSGGCSNQRPAIIVCSSYDEPLHTCARQLEMAEISFISLMGTSTQIARILRNFTTGAVSVLLINTRMLFAGVNLQMASDIILVDDISVENAGQIIGRAQRLGRQGPLTIHCLRYV